MDIHEEAKGQIWAEERQWERVWEERTAEAEVGTKDGYFKGTEKVLQGAA